MGNARFDDQKAVMQKILESGDCPFCPENLAKYHHGKVLREGNSWILTFNQWPREHAKYHLLLILKEHAVSLAELSQEASNEFFDHMRWAERRFMVRGGLLFMRFGETEYSGASVNHLHAQFIVPDKEAPNFEPVRFKVG
ncbi:hypothetical protein A2619_02060 [candidate division WWE3 bacterium RIFOXYD1_FULL_39_9]|uniref:HIT domain-containing protein n=1 Tax=candidate division WWE3 bacterium RIFOXYD1_FULL_39_9 TaxID=1802649 RepID=A0A1F4X3H9_UNCKA|nr:MAG: hypothetical protein A2619_02060 [candidate division WWE3 bacterium RIFOXYD1_FULL_39_9]